MAQLRIRGVYPAAPTPLTPDLTPDPAILAAHCRGLIEAGCDGISVLGTTGEANSFSVQERMALLEGLVDAGIPASRLVPGTGCAALTDTVALTRHAVGLGVAAVLMLPPFYYKDVTVEGLEASYQAVIDRVGDPRLRILLYHIPPVAHVPIPFELIERLLARHAETVVGIKDSSGQPQHILDLATRFPGFSVFAGADPLLLPLMKAGGAGAITAISNLVPSDVVTIHRRFDDPAVTAEVEEAHSRLTALRALMQERPQIAAIKEELARRTGEDAWSRLRPPLRPLSGMERESLFEALGGLLP